MEQGRRGGHRYRLADLAHFEREIDRRRGPGLDLGGSCQALEPGDFGGDSIVAGIERFSTVAPIGRSDR
jgi:hypothetical protein